MDKIDLTELSKEIQAVEKVAEIHNITLHLSDIQVIEVTDPEALPGDDFVRMVFIETSKGKFSLTQCERLINRQPTWVLEQLIFAPTEGQMPVFSEGVLQRLILPT